MNPRAVPSTGRARQILDVAELLFADRGYSTVSINDIGAELGMSGPALYRHFPSKSAILAGLLVATSVELRATAEGILNSQGSAALDGLVAAHVDFAMGHRGMILIQERDAGNLAPGDLHELRATQHAYVEMWGEAIRRRYERVSPELASVTARAVFGLINSTPHNTIASQPWGRELLERLSLAAIDAAAAAHD